jgi:hypothetical protein
VVAFIASGLFPRSAFARSTSEAAAAATITVSPSAGPVGAAVTVTRNGFTKHASGQVQFGTSASSMPAVSTDARGSFSASLKVPNVSAGAYVVTVDVQGVAASTTFTVSTGVASTTTPTPTPPTAGTWSQIESAGFETGNLSEFDATSIEHGSLTVISASPGAAAGSQLAVAQTAGTGNGVNGFARGQWTVGWGQGTVYRAEMSVFLPVDFYASQQGAVQLVGWDTFPTLNNHMRLAIWQSDRLARLYLKTDGKDTTLTNAFAIPEGRWVRIAIEQKVADVGGWSKVYLDGGLVAQGTGDTTTPYPVTRMRYGLVAIDSNAQTNPLTIYFDDVRLSVAQ